jgi:peptidoglycan hydrolase CwlO-like protein
MPESNERIAIVEKAIDGIEKGVSRLEQKLDNLLDNIEKKFVPRTEMDANNRRIESEMDNLRTEMKSLRDKDWKIVGFAVTVIAAAIGSALLILFQ